MGAKSSSSRSNRLTACQTVIKTVQLKLWRENCKKAGGPPKCKEEEEEECQVQRHVKGMARSKC